MATIRCELTTMYRTVTFVRAVGAPWVARVDGKVIGAGKIDNENQFELEVPDDLEGDVEITIGTDGAAPTVIEVNGEDQDILIPYAPGGGYF